MLNIQNFPLEKRDSSWNFDFIKTEMEDLLSLGLGGLKLDDFPSAKLKVEQLFQQWLLLEGKVCISLISLSSGDLLFMIN